MATAPKELFQWRLITTFAPFKVVDAPGKRPSVKSALRPPPTAQAENEKSALFPGTGAEIYFPPCLRPFSGKTAGDFIVRPPEKSPNNKFLLTSSDSLLTSSDSLLTFTDYLLTSTDPLLTSTESLLTSTDYLLTSTDSLLSLY